MRAGLSENKYLRAFYYHNAVICARSIAWACYLKVCRKMTIGQIITPYPVTMNTLTITTVFKLARPLARPPTGLLKMIHATLVLCDLISLHKP